MAIAPGSQVERYLIEERLGAGGFAVVYRARHLTLETMHAIKVLQAEDPDTRKRLLREGRLQAKLRHPNVVQVTDVMEVEGALALVMEYVGGGSLRDMIVKGPLAPAEAEHLFRGIVEGVGYAHRLGFIHRDLKPDNVLLDEQSGTIVPKVADFGLVRLLAEAPEASRLTGAGTAMGTPAYMAPEQCMDAHKVDQRADIFALGAIFYEMLTGCQAFGGENSIQILMAAMYVRYRPISELLPNLEPRYLAVVQGCLVGDPKARIQDCADLLQVLDGRARSSLPVAPTLVLREDETPVPPVFAGDHPVADTLAPEDVSRLLATPAKKSTPTPISAPALTLTPAPKPDQSERSSPTEASPKPARSFPWRRVARGSVLLLPLLVAFTDLSSGLDPFIQFPLVRRMRGPLDLEATVVLAIPSSGDLRSRRAEYPAAIDRLVELGAVAILMDVGLTAATPDDDAIAEAIRRAADKGVPVILPLRMESSGPVLPETPSLRETARFGVARMEADALFHHVRRAPVRFQGADDTWYWHATVETLRARLRATDPPELANGMLVVGGLHNPAPRERLNIPPVGDVPQVAFDRPEDWGRVGGRMVVVGITEGMEDRHPTPDGVRYGVEIQASLLETLFREKALRVLPPEANTLAALVAGLGSLGLGSVLPRRHRILSLMMPLAVLSVAVTLTLAGFLLAIIPVVLASAVGIWAVFPKDPPSGIKG